MPAFCPNCEAEIEQLHYCSHIREYGSADLDGGNCDYSDAETDETTYNCPECGDDLDPDDVEYRDEDEEEEEEQEEKPKEPEIKKIYKEEMFDSRKTIDSLSMAKCKKCDHIFEVDKEDIGDLTCTKCNSKLTTKNSELLTV